VQDIVTPDTLDELDRRVYDLAIQHIPLAEMAVRLGVPVAQADEKLQRVFRRLGVEDREALRAIGSRPTAATPEPPPPGPNEYVIGGDDYVIGLETTAEQELGPERRFSRRAVLGAWAGAALAVGVGGVAAATRGGRGSNSKLPGESDALVAELDGPSLPIEIRGGVGEGFNQEHWLPRELIPWEHGLFSMFVTTGDVTGYQFIDQPRSKIQNYRTGADSRYVWAEDRENLRGYLLDTVVWKSSYTWPLDDLRLVTAGVAPSYFGSWLLFEEMNGFNGNGRFHLGQIEETADRISLKSSFQLPVPGLGSEVVAIPGKPVVHIWGRAVAPALFRIDLESGAVTTLLGGPDPKPGTGGPEDFWSPDGFQAFPDGFRANWGQKIQSSFVQLSQPFSWNGTQLSLAQSGSHGNSWSPDGTRVVREILDLAPPPTSGGTTIEAWPSVHVVDGDGRLQFLVRSAATTFPDGLQGDRWLADSSAFVALVRGDGSNGTANAFQQALIDKDGRFITRLPVPPAPVFRRWFEEEPFRDGRPSPENAELISFGRLHVYNRRTDKWVSANIAGEAGPDFLDPWSGSENNAVFALPRQEFDREWLLPTLIAPRIQRPPLDRSAHFVVVTDSEGLNLRTEPALSGQVVANVPDGSRLRFGEAPGPQAQFSKRDESFTWVFVRTEDGVSGWVNSAYLAWA
jgi:hypothetical protein